MRPRRPRRWSRPAGLAGAARIRSPLHHPWPVVAGRHRGAVAACWLEHRRPAWFASSVFLPGCKRVYRGITSELPARWRRSHRLPVLARLLADTLVGQAGWSGCRSPRFERYVASCTGLSSAARCCAVGGARRDHHPCATRFRHRTERRKQRFVFRPTSNSDVHNRVLTQGLEACVVCVCLAAPVRRGS